MLNNINPQKSKLNNLKTFIEKSNYFELLNTVLRTRVDYDRSAGAGKSVVEYKKDSKAAHEIKSLVKEVRKILNR